MKEKNSEQPIKGIHISHMNAAIIVVSLLLYLSLSGTALHASGSIQDTYRSIAGFSTCAQFGEQFRRGSDFLTEQVRLYVTTEDSAWMDGYFTEIHTTRRREEAVETLHKIGLGEDAEAYLQAAVESSEALVEREVYAMALVSRASGLDEGSLPREVQDVPLTEEDLALAPAALRAKAEELVYGAEYQAAKGQISCDVEDLLYVLSDFYQEHLQAGYDDLHQAMVLHQIFIGIHFAATLIGFVFTLLLVVLPLWKAVKRINKRKMLQVSGAYECKRLARAYNTMFEYISANERALRHQAEHDPLTGLLNRGAFNALQTSLGKYSGSLALLLVDVDKFKEVNDGYGHEMGDRVLKTVARLLTEQFRSSDYPARIGGDEFAVIVMDTHPAETETIAAKITAINQILTHPVDDMPVVSLSVGGAFSEEGFTEHLYNDADLALYAVKEHGRCGCRFYTPELAQTQE